MHDETRARIARMLLAELIADQYRWYYISILTVNPLDPDKVVGGGCFIRGAGPTDAWGIAHRLRLIPEHSQTSTMGPIESENITKVPEDKRWRYLTEEEITSI